MLEAQRRNIEGFGAREGLAVKSWYQDVQTGAGTDALLMRPGLAAALKDARNARCPLIVSRLDRLSRNVHFITGLMEHWVHFIVAAFGKDCDEFTLHIYACIAEQERKMIKAAVAIQKLQGRKFGQQLRPKAEQRRVTALAHAALTKLANEHAEAYRPYIEWALRQPGVNGAPISFSAAAKKLTERNVESPMGRRLRGHQLQRMALRLGIRHPARIPRDLARARVRAMWEQCPEVTAMEVVTTLRRECRLGLHRVRKLLQECRIAVAKRNSLHKKMGWRIDYRTVARIRVGELWAQDPEITAKQAVSKLVSRHSVNAIWVGTILHDCWRASGKHSRKELRIGRKIYGRGDARRG